MNELNLPIKYDSATKTVIIKLEDLIDLAHRGDRPIKVKPGEVVKF
jgi:hypothetical protein